MIAMAILALSLVALSEIDAGAINMHSYAKKLNVAAMLAREKMLDIETQLDEEGLPAEGDNLDPSEGDFDEQGFPGYKWKVEVVAPDADKLDPQKLISMVLGTGDGSDGSDSSSGMPDPGKAGGDLSSLLGSLTGLGSNGSTDSSGAPTPTTAGMSGLGDMAAGALAGPAQMMITQITQMVREVHLTISWMDGRVPQQFTVVEQMVSMGPSAPPPSGNTQTSNTQTQPPPVKH